jgi:uncharacterized protein DUF6152
VSVRKLAVLAMLACSAIAVLALVVVIGASRVSAQIRTYTPPQTAEPGADWTKRWVTIDVPVTDGKTESWGFEGSGAASMVASGISPQILEVGNRVKIIAHPPRDKSKRTAEFMGMEVNGRYYSRGTGSNIREK